MMDGNCDTSDVSNTNRSGEGCRQRLKVAYIPGILWVIVNTPNDSDRVPKFANIYELQPKGEENPRAQEQDNQQRQ